MKFRKILMCGVAAGALGLAAAMPDGTLPNLAPAAEAQVQASVSIGFGTFYDRLSPHGDWVFYEGRHVWVPTSVEDQWRPYTVGRWVYTQPHGWTWVSDEPFSWAVYHYGRWGFTHNIGWYWVPDTQWAPAWVTWRTSGDHIAWAPMPPRGAVQVTFDIDPLGIPARYWVAVPTSRFLAPNIFTVALHPWEPRFYDVVRYTRPAGHVTVVGDVTYNTVINVTYIEQQTNEEVNIYQVRHTDEPSATNVEGDSVAMFAPAVEDDQAEPEEVRSLEEVTEQRQAAVSDDEPEEGQLDEPVDVAEDADPVPEEAIAEDIPPEGDEVTEEETTDEAPATVTEEEATDEAPATVTEEETTDEAPATVTEEETTDEAPAATAPTAEDEADVTAEDPEPGVEERAIGEPAEEEEEEEEVQ